MFNYIKGEVVSKEDGLLVLENNGIGFEIYVSNQAIMNLPAEGQNAFVYTYQNVKEDEISLYGFYCKEEKDMFLKLIEVNGIGPKMALGILSNIALTDLEIAILNQDTKILSKVKGIGGKTAERIVLELKDKIEKSAHFEFVKESANSKEMEDAISGLEMLGVARIDAVKQVRLLAKPNDKAEEIIEKVLKSRAN